MTHPTYKKLWIGLGVLVLLSPLGIILPEKAKAGAAWGEWSAKELKSIVGYVPQKLEKWQKAWGAVFPNYAIEGIKKPWQIKLAYILSGIVGVSIIVAMGLWIGKRLSLPEDHEGPHAP